MYRLKIHKWLLKGLGRNIASSIPGTILDAGGVREENIAGSRQAHMLYLTASSLATIGDRRVC